MSIKQKCAYNFIRNIFGKYFSRNLKEFNKKVFFNKIRKFLKSYSKYTLFTQTTSHKTSRNTYIKC